MTDGLSNGHLKVLVVDDEPYILQAWKKILSTHDCEVRTLSDGEDVIPVVTRWRPNVTVLDIRMPRVSGLDLLKEIKTRDLPTEVVMMTAFGTIETAVDAVKSGAYDYLTKPFSNIDDVALTVLKAGKHNRLLTRNRELESLLTLRDGYEGLVGSSPQMKSVFELVECVAYSTSTVLIQGESGTGKELVARAIHHRSPRHNRPFVAVNCSALTDTLLESELFGHEKGSFTGATGTKKGLFEMADGGSIFLDEIGHVPPPTQVKLLRILQEGELRRVGGNDVRKVDVRVIAATNVDLAEETSAGNFREDLFYRLNVICVDLPALRERSEDIPLLAMHFLKKYTDRMGKTIPVISPEALEILESHPWPGNVRELENAIERAVVLCRTEIVGPADLPTSLTKHASFITRPGQTVLHDLPYRKAKQIAQAEFDRHYVTALLGQTDGNLSEASRRAGMDRSNFRRIVKRYGLSVSETNPGRNGGVQ